jgi:hypothetical protein
VSIVVSDPWDFVTENGSTFTASVRAIEGGLLLLVLAGQHYVASPRGGDSYDLIPVTVAQSRGVPPWGRDKWRGQPTALLAQISGL